ncbi:MAG TPA: hypothetical protein VJS44_05080 [Pyrinomonadaceae bacterium]|nr:hypothetical protein [Pyrinomonadaceae bacterium]
MNASQIEERNFFGLFELDDAGTVLYSRVEPDGRSSNGAGASLTGQNFFKEIVPCVNGEELRRRITRFASSEIQADNFIFNCQIENAPLTVRVLLARISERSNGEKTKSILVHIRKP